MTQKEKQLLLKDLSARLPYGVKVIQDDVVMETLQSICKVGDNDYTVNPLTNDMYNGFHIEQVKPYLRPMSSMTEEEENEYRTINCYEGLFPSNEEALDYVLEHHFDYRGLIDKGLALEAPTDMYKTE